MAVFLTFKSRSWMALASLIAHLVTSPSLSQTAGKERAGLPSMGVGEETTRFIVAFELSEQNGFAFNWPFESMRAAPYETVVMAVEGMPRVRNGKHRHGEARDLVASRCVRINGRQQKPYRTANRQTVFLVKLNEGRLRVSLSIPPGFTVDGQPKTVAIKLYQIQLRREQ
jgi:hypothetical protein